MSGQDSNCDQRLQYINDHKTESGTHKMSAEVLKAHSFHEAGMKLIFSKDVQVEVPDVK